MKLIVVLLMITPFSIFASGEQLPLFKVNGIKVNGKNNVQTEKMKNALTIFEKVMNDVEFQADLGKKKFKSDRNDDLIFNPTPEQVIKKIWAASEHYKTNADQTADIYWSAKNKSWLQKLRDSDCTNIGYGYPSEREIYTYTCFLDDNNSMAKLVGHIAHEWSHKLGFEHRMNNHSERNLTVPYTFGDLVTEYARKHL